MSTGVGGSSPTASAAQPAPDVADADVEGFHPYRSPEHLAGERLDHRSDIFSIGAVLYEMATGQQAFPGDTPSRIAAAIVSGTPATSGVRSPSLEAIEPIVHRALEKDPDGPLSDCVGPARGSAPCRRRTRHVGHDARQRASAPEPRPAGRRAGRNPGRGRGRLVVVPHASSRADRASCPAGRQRRQRHQRSRLRRHAAAGADGTSGPVAVPRHRVRRSTAADAPDDGTPWRRAGDPYGRTRGVRAAPGRCVDRGQRVGGRTFDGGRPDCVRLHVGKDHCARSGRGRAQGRRPQSGRPHRLVHAPGARRVGRLAREPQRPDSGSDDALARGVEGVHCRCGQARGRRRDRVDPLLRARHPARWQLRARLHDALEHLWRPGRDRTRRGIRAAGLRAPRHRQRAGAAVHRLSGTTTA